MNQQPETARYYNALAGIYDTATSNGAWLPNVELTKMLDRVGTPQSLLDLGCGTGQTIDAVKSKFVELTVTGVDFSSKMLDAARAKLSGDSFYEADLLDFMKNNSDEFDLITSIGALEFVAEQQLVLQEVAQHLHRGGYFIFTYEPVIPGLPGQSEVQSVSKGSALEMGTITTYRQEMNDVTAALQTAGLAVLSSSIFVSYHRGSSPVVYIMHLCQAN